MSTPAITLSLKIEFSGGLELLFSNQRSHRLSIPARVPADNTPVPPDSANAPANQSESGAAEYEANLTPNQSTQEEPPHNATKPADISYLIAHLRAHLLKERVELFVENGTVRPGILVLVNSTDWELEGEGAYILQDGDEVVFISTLHGG